MKKAFLFATVICMSITCFAQTASWKEFNDFHNTVSKVLHPVMMGNIQPVKDSSTVLLAKAKTWQSSAVPKEVKADVFETSVAELVKQCTALDEAVKARQPDATLRTMAIKVHNTFHTVLSACNIKD